jgi:hypothetical protein
MARIRQSTTSTRAMELSTVLGKNQKTVYLFSHTAENFQPFSGKVTGKSIREQRQSLYEALTEKPTAPITDEG